MNVFVAICLLLAVLPAQAIERIALIIGNNEGLAEDAPLRFATEDAKSLHATLTELGSIQKDRSYLLLNPSKARIQATFQEILGRSKEIRLKGEKTLIFVYYSGHGDPASFHIRGETLKLDEVREFFSRVEADIKVLVADACHSGALISAKGAKLGDPLPLDFTQEVDARGSVILTSSSASELSRESKELQGSVFTHYLVTGLRGGADHDRDGQVSLQEAYEYARLQIALSTKGYAKAQGVDQTPQYAIDLQGSSPLILTELARGSAKLRLAGLVPGEYTLFRDRRSAMASLRLSAGDTVLLALPKGMYLLRRSAAQKIYLAEADLNWSPLAVLTAQHFSAYPLDILKTKGNLPLTHRPWQAFVEQEAIRAFPDDLVMMLPTMAGMRHQWEDWSLAIIGAWIWPHRLQDGDVQMQRRGFSLAAEGRYSLFERSQYLVFTGAMARYWSLEQKPSRADEESLKRAGYPTMATIQGDAWSAATLLGVELRLPLHWVFSLQARPGWVFWQSSKGAMQSAWRNTAGLSFGYRF